MNDIGIDALYEELTIDRETAWPESLLFTGFGGNPDFWNWYNGQYPVPPSWNPKNLRDIIYYNKKKEIHRIYGPAYVSKLYDVEAWFKDGKLHRDGAPAYRHRGNFVWFKDGKLHNLEGPAVVERGGPLQYWIDGVKYTRKQYKWEITRRKRRGML